MYNLRMRDGESMKNHMNTLNIMASSLLSIDTKILDEEKCISLLYYLLDLRSSLVVSIGSNRTTLGFN